MSIISHSIGILTLENPRFIEGKQKPPQGLSMRAHHIDNARYFLIITPFPLARIVTPKPAWLNRWEKTADIGARFGTKRWRQRKRGGSLSEDIEEMNGNGCRVKSYRDNYLLTPLYLASPTWGITSSSRWLNAKVLSWFFIVWIMGKGYRFVITDNRRY